jgi:hypothetical protein
MMPPVAVRRGGHRRLLMILGAGIGAVVLLVVVVALVSTPSPNRDCRPPACGGNPPTGEPIHGDVSYSSDTYGFSADYFKYDSIEQDATPSADALRLDYPTLKGGPGTLLITARKADGGDARSVVDAVVNDAFPGARAAYPLPGTSVGYRPGYGMVYDYYPQSANGAAGRDRVFVLAAVKNDLAVVALATSPYFEFSSDGISTGHPSGANALIALFADDPINTVRWPGDPAR